MRIHFKLLAPMLVVAAASIGLKLNLNDVMARAEAERARAELEATTITDAIETADRAWRVAVDGARAGDPPGSVALNLFIFERNLELLEKLEAVDAGAAAMRQAREGAEAWKALWESGGASLEQPRSWTATERVSGALRRLGRETTRRTNAIKDALTQQMVAVVNHAILVLSILAFLAVAVGYSITRSLIAPLRRLARDAETVAAGGALDKFRPLNRSDEIGQLASALMRMIASIDENTARMERMAYVDAETGLPSKSRLRELMADAAQTQRDQSLILVAVDGWDRLQSLFGASMARKAARSVSGRLSAAVARAGRGGEGPGFTPEAATLARIAPDKFALLIDAANPSAEALAALMRDLATPFSTPFQIDGRQIRLFPRIAAATAALARAETGSEGPVEDALLNAAVLALEADPSKTAAPQVFSSAIREKIIQRRETEEALRGAVRRDELELHFQPQIAQPGYGGRSPRIWGGEALLRWRRDGALVPPGQFIPIAEESGLIGELDDWVLGAACRAAEGWRLSGLDLYVSANVSPLRLEQGGYADAVAWALDASGLPAERLKIEVTETTAMGDPDRISELLTQIRTLGAQVAIDDFGSGYSNLSTLARLPFTILKLDRTLLPSNPADRDAFEILRSVAELAKRLELITVFEGVETIAGRDLVRRVGGDIIQGYFYSRPLTERAFLAFVDSFSETAEADRLVEGRRT